MWMHRRHRDSDQHGPKGSRRTYVQLGRHLDQLVNAEYRLRCKSLEADVVIEETGEVVQEAVLERLLQVASDLLACRALQSAWRKALCHEGVC